MTKYKKLYINLINNLKGGGKKYLIMLDIDETLGEFHLQYEFIATMIENFISSVETKNKLHQELLRTYFIRPDLIEFMRRLKSFVDINPETKIIVFTKNCDDGKYPGYISNLVKNLEIICNCVGLIYKIYSKQEQYKDMFIIEQDLGISFDKIIVFEDRQENVIHKSKSIVFTNITPYFIYLDYITLRNIFKQIKSIIDSENKDKTPDEIQKININFKIYISNQFKQNNDDYTYFETYYTNKPIDTKNPLFVEYKNKHSFVLLKNATLLQQKQIISLLEIAQNINYDNELVRCFDELGKDDEIIDLLSNCDLLKLSHYDDLLQKYPRFETIILDKYKKECYSIINNTIQKDNTLPLIYWQEFYYLFFIAYHLAIIHYSDNSIIVGLGESPNKLIFTQQCMFAELDKTKFRTYPQNLSFIEMPISNICDSLLGEKFIDIDKVITEDILRNPKYVDETIQTHKENYIELIISDITKEEFNVRLTRFSDLSMKNSMLLNTHLKRYGLSPDIIISSIGIVKKEIIFVDRTESMSSIVCFIFGLYGNMKFHNYTDEEMVSVINIIKFVGFDGDYDSRLMKQFKIDYVNTIIKSLFKIKDDNKFKIYYLRGNEFTHPGYIGLINKIIEKLKEINVPFVNMDNSKITDLDLINYLTLTLNIPYKIVNYLSLPEKYNIGSRCIAKFNIGKEDFTQNKNKLMLLSNGEGVASCNLHRSIIIYTIKKCIDKIISMITSIHKIKPIIFSNLRINKTFIDIFNKTPKELNNLKFRANTVVSFITHIFGSNGIMLEDTIFSDDNYVLPI